MSACPAESRTVDRRHNQGRAVDPANPAYSVLGRGVKPGLVFLAAVCLLFAIGGMVLLVVSSGSIPAGSGAAP